MQHFKKFMAGRYGSDQLNMALIGLSLVITLTARLFRIPILPFFGYIPLALCIFRMFSKDIYKRRIENGKFMSLTKPLTVWFKNLRIRLTGSKEYRYYSCPKCKTLLRLPKGKGKVAITCPKCKNKFEKKT